MQKDANAGKGLPRKAPASAVKGLPRMQKDADTGKGLPREWAQSPYRDSDMTHLADTDINEVSYPISPHRQLRQQR